MACGTGIDRERSASARSGRSSAGGAGARTSATGPGPPSARTTAPTATPGGTCRTTWPGARRIAGARTASPAICDRYQLLVLRARVLERPRPDPQGAAVRRQPDEGNHGEDVKEYYFYVDNTPTHSYMRMLYKYPQAEFPYRGWSRRTGAATARTPSSS